MGAVFRWVGGRVQLLHSFLIVFVLFVSRDTSEDTMAQYCPINELKAMTDAFEGIDRLAEGAPRMEGAPNMRRMPGFPLFGCGQPTLDGYEKVLEPVLMKYANEAKVFWVTLRQEPVIYVNGRPLSVRDPTKLEQKVDPTDKDQEINFHLEIDNPEEVTELEAKFAEEIRKRGEEFNEKLDSVTTISEIYEALKEKVPKIDPIRIPTNQEKAPSEDNFDKIVDLLKDTSASTPVVFNCQAGISRTTTAMVMAALVKELQLTRELDQMRGIVPDDILDALKKKKLGLPGIDIEITEEKNPMQMGEFEVIKELIAAFPQAKMAFDVSSDDWQVFLKNKIMNNIERYFYLIVFAMYVREVGPKQFPVSFKQFMETNANLRTMIAEGRGKLEWERKVPDDKLHELKGLLSCPNFKDNIPQVIKKIYELSWDMFGDLPRGHHKNNSMHKLASKTMIEILPENLAAHVEKQCGSLA